MHSNFNSNRRILLIVLMFIFLQGYLFCDAAVKVYTNARVITPSLVRIKLYIVNDGPEPIESPVCYYYFTVEDNKEPDIIVRCTPGTIVSLEHVSGDDYRIKYDFAGKILEPGSRLPSNKWGNSVIMYYTDHSTWDKENDWSYKESACFSINENVVVYDKDGKYISGTNPLDESSLFLEIGNEYIKTTINSEVNSIISVLFSPEYNDKTYTVKIGYEIVGEAGGIEISSDRDNNWSPKPGQMEIINLTIKTFILGSYTLIIYGEIVGTGVRVEKTCEITVLSPEIVTGYYPLGIVPDTILQGETETLMFALTLKNNSQLPEELAIEEVSEAGEVLRLVTSLNDDGENGDLCARDLVYSGIGSAETEEETSLWFRARGKFPGIDEPVYSDPAELCVSQVPVGLAPFDESKTFFEAEKNLEICSNQLLITYEEDFSIDRVKEVLIAEGCEIIGSMAGLIFLHVETPEFTDIFQLNNFVENLKQYPEISEVDVIEVIRTQDLVLPNDPEIPFQYHLNTIRASEAWIVSGGTTLIGVIDSGVDYQSKDLASKLRTGINRVNKGAPPSDDNGHGTSVAGVIGAVVDNQWGIAGITWDNPMYVTKVLKENNDGDLVGTDADLAFGILNAVNMGCKVVNLSVGGYKLTNAVNYACRIAELKGAIIIAAAGNDYRTEPFYPAAIDSVVAVGATDELDSLALFSNHGDWITLGAPGSFIRTLGLNNQIKNVSGTSVAAPIVSGAVALAYSVYGGDRKQIIEALKGSCVDIKEPALGAGRLDLFEFLFNGSFEFSYTLGWEGLGNIGNLTSIGEIFPVDRNGHNKKFLYLSTGPAGDNKNAVLTKNFSVNRHYSGMNNLNLAFDYNFISEEFPEWVGTIYNDKLNVTITLPNGQVRTLLKEDTNSASFSTISGINFPGGDNTMGTTGWKAVNVNVPFMTGKYIIEIIIEDTGDDIYDSWVLIDNIRFQ